MILSPVAIFLAAIVQLIVYIWALYQLGTIAQAARATEENTAKTVLLLTVLANHQGATAADVEKAMGTREKAAAAK